VRVIIDNPRNGFYGTPHPLGDFFYRYSQFSSQNSDLLLDYNKASIKYCLYALPIKEVHNFVQIS